MQYNVIKMNGRYTKYGYQYLVEFSKSITSGTGVLDFDRCCRWFNDQFGWSQDVETRRLMMENRRHYPDNFQPNDINPVWGYCAKYSKYRIYIDNEKTLSWFMLCHPKS
jgi:hypothetical protein